MTTFKPALPSATQAGGRAYQPGAVLASSNAAAPVEAGMPVPAASTVGVLPRSPAVEALSVAARFGDRTAAAPPVPRFTCRGAGGVETVADGRHRAHRPSATTSTETAPPSGVGAVSELTAVSLFAGVGGFDLALTRAGVKVVAAVEIDKAARGVLRDQFPDVTLFSDVREVTGDALRAAGFVPERGILAGGFPCQDLSVAGRRGGLGEGTRSGLYWEMDRLVGELGPAWVVYENVPGLLSAVCPDPDSPDPDHDELLDGGAFLLDDQRSGGLAGGKGACEGGCFPAHGGAMGLVLGSLADRGYGFAYRVLDAQYFGVPQRRRRVFVVGRAGGDSRGPVQVLLEPESGGGGPASGGEAGQGVAGGSAVSTLQGGGGRGYRVDAEGAAGGQLIATALTAREGKGPDSSVSSGNIVRIAHTLTGEGFDASEDGTGRGTPLVPVPIALRGRDAGSNIEAGEPGDPAFTVRTPGGGSSYPMIAAEAVRRLTPLECERLQGFPDGWTATSNGRPQADGPRYRQCGNAVAVPVVEWIARRTVRVDAEQRAGLVSVGAVSKAGG